MVVTARKGEPMGWRLRSFMSRASLRMRLLGLSLAALAPSFAVVGFTEWQVTSARHDEINELALQSARQAAFELDRIVAGVQSLLLAVAAVPDVRRLDEQGCSAYLAALRPSLGEMAAISVFDAAGRFRCGSAEQAPPDVDYSDRPYFRDALNNPRAVVGLYTLGRVSGRAILPVALALRDEAGRPTAVLVAGLDLARLGAALKTRGLSPGGSLTVADREGTIIAREPYPERFVGTRIPEAFLRLVTAPAAGTETVLSQDGTRRVLGYVPVAERPEGLYVSAGLSAQASYDGVARAARIGALLAVTGALATLGATLLVGNSAFIQPLETLADVLDRWRRGERDVRTGFDGRGGEIGALGAALDRMMDEIGDSQRQRDLLADELAHRVKNTLTTVQAIAASTLNRTEPAAAALPVFQARVTALARTLDTLTRASWEACDLRELARQVIAPLCGDPDERFLIDGPRVVLPPREALGMTMMLHELCTNALKYGALSVPSGRIALVWHVAVAEGGETTLDLEWRESGGPAVVHPGPARGFGSRLIRRAFGEAGTAALDFPVDGLVCRASLTFRGVAILAAE